MGRNLWGGGDEYPPSPWICTPVRNILKCSYNYYFMFSVALLEGNLSSVEALKDIKEALKKRKDVCSHKCIRINELYCLTLKGRN